MRLINKVLLSVFILINFSFADAKNPMKEFSEKPLVERYILDELKDLRTGQLKIREDVTKQITSSELSVSDRAIRYATDTVNNIFYIIAAVSSLLLLVGLKTFKELKESSELIVEEKVTKLSQEFEGRLLDIENKAKERFKLIMRNQENIEQSQKINSLWKRAEIEDNFEEKLNIYDEILKLNANDVETLAYKADVLLDMDEARWALSLCNQAIEIDDEYGLSYWQRACANAQLNNIDSAIEDIKHALEITPSLQDELENESSFKPLYENEFFKKIIS
ncbi:MAG: tetratricopeptide (TPR) repeat protein [Arcobacteraceae bacterium]|jgi:tetratricopeptide (TPR) repeat protein